MTMAPDTRIGPYEITRDTKLALLAASNYGQSPVRMNNHVGLLRPFSVGTAHPTKTC